MQVLFEKFLGDFRTFFTARITDFKGFVVASQYIVPGVSHLVPSGGCVCIRRRHALAKIRQQRYPTLSRKARQSSQTGGSYCLCRRHTQPPPFLNNLRRRKNVLWREKRGIGLAAYTKYVRIQSRILTMPQVILTSRL